MPYATVAFYITAHQDDWQLFRGEVAYADVKKSSSKVVFIHTTAGDAGLTNGWWEAREQGAIAAVRSALPPQPVTTHVQTFNGHPVQRYVCANTVIYFMRLPDGNGYGTGYPSNHYQSLTKLRDGGMALAAVDGSTTYSTWSDFCATLAALVVLEREEIPQDHPWIHAVDYCATINPDDHPDHKATADAVRSFAAPKFNRAWFHTYCISRREANLRSQDYDAKKCTWDAYSNEALRITTLGGYPVEPCFNEWDAWGGRSYCRLVPFDQPDVDDPFSSLEMSQ
jgi:hypothetical protein